MLENAIFQVIWFLNLQFIGFIVIGSSNLSKSAQLRVTHLIPCQTRKPNASYLWACTPVRKNASRHLHANLETLYLLE